MATALTAEQRALVVERATKKAQESGLPVEQVLHTYAVSQGLDNSQLDQLMGYEAGNTQKWADAQGANRGNVTQQANDLGFEIKTGSTNGQSVTGAKPATTAQPSTPVSNLGMGGNYTAAQTYTPTSAGPAAQTTATGYNPTTAAATAPATANGYTPTMQGAATTAAGASYSPTMLGNATAYSASKANLGLGLQSLGSSDPSQANAQLLSGKVNNPYLDAQADNITKRLNRNLQENILPGIGQGATMAGQYGGSRQGIAQGKAIGDTNDNLANALTNMYSGANEAAQGRMAGAAGSLSGIGASIESQNASAQNQAGQFNAGSNNQFSMANQGAANQAGQYNAGLTMQNSQFNAAQANAMAGMNQNAANQASQFGAAAQNQVNQYNTGLSSQNNQYNAGLQNQASQFGANAQNQANQYNAGATTQGNQYNAGLQNQAGQFNANATNNYNLGLRSSDLGFAGLDANIAQNNFSNQLAGANFGLNVYNTLGQQNSNATNTATNVQNTPMNYQNNFGAAANAGGGQGTSVNSSTATQSNPWLGAVAGAQTGNAWQYPKP